MKPTLKDFRKLFLEERSRDQIFKIIDLVAGDPELFAHIWALFCCGEPPLPQYSAWALQHISDRQPELLEPYLEKLVDRFPFMEHPAEARTAMRILSQFPPPQAKLGELIEIAFEKLESPLEPIAVRVFAMQVLYNVSQLEPELKREIALVIKAHLPDGSAGFRNRGSKIIKKLEKEMRAEGRF